MKNLLDHSINRYRIRDERVTRIYGSAGGATEGAFEVYCMETGHKLFVIASAGEGWDHVSVSMSGRMPNWTDMEYVKRMFFKDDETAMQLHVPPSEHINRCVNCLHLWRPLFQVIPRPPAGMVG